MHHRVAIPPGEWQLESISSPWSLANCAFVQERSSLTVEGFCAPSVAPKKRKTPAFCRWAVEGGGEAGGVGPVDGLLKEKHPLKIPFTSAASRLPLCGVFFCSRKATTRYDGRNPAGWMASSRMRLGRRPKDDDPHKEMCRDHAELWWRIDFPALRTVFENNMASIRQRAEMSLVEKELGRDPAYRLSQ